MIKDAIASNVRSRSPTHNLAPKEVSRMEWLSIANTTNRNSRVWPWSTYEQSPVLRLATNRVVKYSPRVTKPRTRRKRPFPTKPTLGLRAQVVNDKGRYHAHRVVLA
jgi:hypothetical protein